VTTDRIAERTAEILALSRSLPRVMALPEEGRIAWARRNAQRDLASDPWLPGGLSWIKIETTFRSLGSRSPGLDRHGVPYRRRRPDQPSRPELAAELMTSPATLRRACMAAGRGVQWPPVGL
jgi:hypothetical protein